MKTDILKTLKTEKFKKFFANCTDKKEEKFPHG
jgi:hypothetical protein